MASVCKTELDVTCSVEEAKCDGKYHQGTEGIIGLTIDYDKLESRAFCGPFGKCVGEVVVAVNIHKPAEGVRLDCAMENHYGDESQQMVMMQKRKYLGGRLSSNFSKKLEGCGQRIEGPEAKCTMPMPKHLPSHHSIEGLCRLVEDETGRILTKDAWFKITNPNKYKEPDAAELKKKGFYKLGRQNEGMEQKGGAAPLSYVLALTLPALTLHAVFAAW